MRDMTIENTGADSWSIYVYFKTDPIQSLGFMLKNFDGEWTVFDSEERRPLQTGKHNTWLEALPWALEIAQHETECFVAEHTNTL